MRLLAVPTLILSVASIFIFQDKSNVQPSPETHNPGVEHRDRNPKTQNAPNKKSESKPPAAIVENQDVHRPTLHPDPGQEKQTDDDRAHERLYRRYVYATISGVIIATGALLALIWQTIATRKAANASKASADALMSIERAWVLVEVTHTIGIKPHKGAMSHWFHWSCKNFGRTPAWITEIEVRFIRISSVDDLPKGPVYEKKDSTGSVPEGTAVIAPDEEWSYDIPLEYGNSIYEEVHSKCMNKTEFLYAFGCIRYLDIFERNLEIKRYRETQFGAIFETEPGTLIGRFRIAGPSAYNRHT